VWSLQEFERFVSWIPPDFNVHLLKRLESELANALLSGAL